MVRREQLSAVRVHLASTPGGERASVRGENAVSVDLHHVVGTAGPVVEDDVEPVGGSVVRGGPLADPARELAVLGADLVRVDDHPVGQERQANRFVLAFPGTRL